MIDQIIQWFNSVLTTPELLLPFIVGLAVMGIIVILATSLNEATPAASVTHDFYSEYQKSVLLKKLNEK